jgi:tellurite resistance protein TehA-like permease
MVLLAGTQVTAQNTGTFNQADRERLIRLEEKFESLQKQQELTNQRIDDLKSDVKSRLGDVMTFMYWGFGILFTMMMVLMGFVLWDRRTAIKPIENRTHQLEEALIEYAKTDPKLKEILRKAAIY